MQLKAITPHPITSYLGKEVNIQLAITSFQGVLESKDGFSQNNPLKEAKFCHAHPDILGLRGAWSQNWALLMADIPKKGWVQHGKDKIPMLILATHFNPTHGFLMKELLRKSVDVSAFIYSSSCSPFSLSTPVSAAALEGTHSQAAGWLVIMYSTSAKPEMVCVLMANCSPVFGPSPAVSVVLSTTDSQVSCSSVH